GYLFDATGAAAVRPVIQQAPLDLSPGQTFTVRVDNPANIRNTLALMPFGSTTHGLSMTAGPIDPSFSVQADGSLSVTLPAFVPPPPGIGCFSQSPTRARPPCPGPPGPPRPPHSTPPPRHSRPRRPR